MSMKRKAARKPKQKVDKRMSPALRKALEKTSSLQSKYNASRKTITYLMGESHKLFERSKTFEKSCEEKDVRLQGLAKILDERVTDCTNFEAQVAELRAKLTDAEDRVTSLQVQNRKLEDMHNVTMGGLIETAAERDRLQFLCDFQKRELKKYKKDVLFHARKVRMLSE